MYLLLSASFPASCLKTVSPWSKPPAWSSWQRIRWNAVSGHPTDPSPLGEHCTGQEPTEPSGTGSTFSWLRPSDGMPSLRPSRQPWRFLPLNTRLSCSARRLPDSKATVLPHAVLQITRRPCRSAPLKVFDRRAEKDYDLQSHVCDDWRHGLWVQSLESRDLQDRFGHSPQGGRILERSDRQINKQQAQCDVWLLGV